MKSPSPSGGIHPIGDDSGGVEIQPPAFDRMIVLSVYRIINFRNGYKLVFSESPIITIVCISQTSSPHCSTSRNSQSRVIRFPGAL